MDMRARTLLAKIKTLDGCKNAIIAGGAVRDLLLEKEPKDYDFFISSAGYINAVRLLREETGKALQRHPETKMYINSVETLQDVFQGEYEGLKIELMRMNIKDDENFFIKVLNTFDYGICMAYYEGGSVLRSNNLFDEDVKKKTITLHKLKSISHLPKAMERFNRIREKLGNQYKFGCSVLEIKESSKVADTITDNDANAYHKDFNPFGDGQVLRPRAAPQPARMGNHVGEVVWDEPLIVQQQPPRDGFNEINDLINAVDAAVRAIDDNF